MAPPIACGIKSIQSAGHSVHLTHSQEIRFTRTCEALQKLQANRKVADQNGWQTLLNRSLDELYTAHTIAQLQNRAYEFYTFLSGLHDLLRFVLVCVELNSHEFIWHFNSLEISCVKSWKFVFELRWRAFGKYFRTIAQPSSGSSSRKLITKCYQSKLTIELSLINLLKFQLISDPFPGRFWKIFSEAIRKLMNLRKLFKMWRSIHSCAQFG